MTSSIFSNRLKMLGTLTIDHDNNLSGSGDAAKDLATTLGYLLAVAYVATNTKLEELVPMLDERSQTSDEPRDFDSNEPLFCGTCSMFGVRYDVYISFQKIIVFKWVIK